MNGSALPITPLSCLEFHLATRARHIMSVCALFGPIVRLGQELRPAAFERTQHVPATGQAQAFRPGVHHPGERRFHVAIGGP